MKAKLKSRKGFKLKSKTLEQTTRLREFLENTKENEWSKENITRLAEEIGLTFKSTNKWLWDQKNRLEMQYDKNKKEVLKRCENGCKKCIFKIKKTQNQDDDNNSDNNLSQDDTSVYADMNIFVIEKVKSNQLGEKAVHRDMG